MPVASGGFELCCTAQAVVAVGSLLVRNSFSSQLGAAGWLRGGTGA